MNRLLIVFYGMTLLVNLFQTHGAAAEGVQLTVLNAMERIGQDQPPFGRPKALISAARNEWESFQVVVHATDENITVTGVEVADFLGLNDVAISAEHVTLYREEYVRVRCSTPRADLPPGLYADALVPFVNPFTYETIEPRRETRERWGGPITRTGYDMSAAPFEVFHGQNQPLWIDVHVPNDAAAGVYISAIRVHVRGAGTVEVPVELTVWDFTLPDSPTHNNHFGDFRRVAQYFDVPADSEEFRAIESRYCQAMVDHRLTPPIPRHLLPDVNAEGSLAIDSEKHESLKQYIREMHICEVEIPRAPFARLSTSATEPDYKEIPPVEREKAQQYYRAYYDYLKANDWHEGAFVYLWDEPNLRENYEQVLVLGELVHEAVPELKCLVVEQTYKQDPSWPDIDPAVDIWCPLWAFLDRDSIEAKIAGGDEVWSYTALAQRSPRYHPKYEQVQGLEPPYWHIDRPMIVYRVPTWINRQYGVTGLLYWTTVTTVLDPWNNPAFAHPYHYNGGGYLFYPGTPCGVDGPIPSMRLKNLRDGMEDYDYLALLEELAGAEAVTQFVDEIAPNWWEYCRDPETLLSVRRAIAEEIELAAAP